MGAASRFDHLGQPDLLVFCQQRVAADVAKVQTDQILLWRLHTPGGQWAPFPKDSRNLMAGNPVVRKYPLPRRRFPDLLDDTWLPQPSATTGNVCLVAHSNLQAPPDGFAEGNLANVPGGSTSAWIAPPDWLSRIRLFHPLVD